MDETNAGRGAPRATGPSRRGPRASYAALDLGTNNCRLLVAEPSLEGGFRVVDGYSRIVRLGEGLSTTGRLSDEAMARTMKALRACVAKLDRHRPRAVGCIATQACRGAENGEDFLADVQRELGLKFRIIAPADEARYAVLGCANLIDEDAEAALIVDIGGGSTELSFVDAPAAIGAMKAGKLDPAILSWTSSPVGVVTLAERYPEPDPHADWYERMVNDLTEQFAKIEACEKVKAAFANGRAHIVGTSGTVTSLAGVHLSLRRYKRNAVDGIWLTRHEISRAVALVRQLSRAERDNHPCVGPDRADLVIPGCAILEAVCRIWPVERVRVADRGLREGVLLTLMAQTQQ